MEKHVWRFQSDPPMGDKDPEVTVFLGEAETYDGVTSVRQDTRDPVKMKLSELMNAINNPAAFATLQAKQKADEKERMKPKAEPQ